MILTFEVTEQNKKMHPQLTDILNIEHPIIVAPMFLISNVEMIIAALEGGATAAFPALNYRTDRELRDAIQSIRSRTDKPFGVNLIVNKSNPKYKSQLETLVDLKPNFIITSLGNPKETIQQCKPQGIKVFCDVINVEQAKKVEGLGADAVIAVNNKAGGHCGPDSQDNLISSLLDHCNIPVISAGGIANAGQIKDVLNKGASGVSVGTLFLAAKEANISDAYRQALIDYGADDIVLTTKLSGTHLTVINTPYVQQMGTKATFLEKVINRNKKLKKYAKMLLAYRGMKKIKKSTFNATYQTIFCAGPAIEHIHAIRPLKEILNDLTGP
jgi:nitronate monooxygenase